MSTTPSDCTAIREDPRHGTTFDRRFWNQQGKKDAPWQKPPDGNAIGQLEDSEAA